MIRKLLCTFILLSFLLDFFLSFFLFFFHINADNTEHGDGSRISDWSESLECCTLAALRYTMVNISANDVTPRRIFLSKYFSSFALSFLSNLRMDHYSFFPFSRSFSAYIYVYVYTYTSCICIDIDNFSNREYKERKI